MKGVLRPKAKIKEKVWQYKVNCGCALKKWGTDVYVWRSEKFSETFEGRFKQFSSYLITLCIGMILLRKVRENLYSVCPDISYGPLQIMKICGPSK